jgi:NADH-quinone oxidoreductase subunit E
MMEEHEEGSEQRKGPDEGSSGEATGSQAPESAEAGQRADESGEPPVPEGGTPPGGKQAGEEVGGDQAEDEGAGGAETEAAPGASEEAGAEQVPEAGDPGSGVPDELREEIERIMARYPQKRSASIPALFAVQQRYGWCSPEGIAQAAAVMGVTGAYLESVASFYDLFHLEPAGEHRVLVCTNISCWMNGADELLEAFCDAAGADLESASHGGILNEAGDMFVSGFECLGACDIAPMVSIDERYYGPLELAEAATAIEALRSGAEVLPERALARRAAAGGPEPEPDERVAAAERG